MDDEQISFDDLLMGKMNEMKQIYDVRQKNLERKLLDKEQSYYILEQKFKELEQDFNYNLQVIEQRDQDIEEITSKMQEFRNVLLARQQQIQELEEENGRLQSKNQNFSEKIHDKQQILYEKIDDLKQEVKFHKNSIGEMTVQHQKEKESLEQKIQQLSQKLEGIQDQNSHHIQSSLQRQQVAFDLEREKLEKLLFQMKNDKQEKEIEFEKYSQRLLLENEKILNDLNREREKILNLEREKAEELNFLRNKLQESQVINTNLEKEIDNFRKSNNSWELIMKEKIDLLINEKEKLADELVRQKMKHKQKLRDLKETGEIRFEELIKENADKQRKLENQIRDLQIQIHSYEMSEKNQRERIQEREQRQRKELDEIENKFGLLLKNNEEDRRRLHNDLELKDFHLRQLNEEKEQTNKKINEINNKIEEITKVNQTLENENKLLIEEVIRFRRGNQEGQQNQQRQLEPIIEEKIKQSQKIKGQNRVSPKRKNFKMDDIERLMADEEDQEVESFEQLFSDDEGPVSELKSMQMTKLNEKGGAGGKNQFSQQQNNDQILASLKSSNSGGKNLSSKQIYQLRKMKEYEQEVQNYKIIIDSMTNEMDNAKKKIILNNQEVQIQREENMHLRGRLNEMQYDLMNWREKYQKLELEKASLPREEIDKFQEKTKKQDKVIEELENEINELGCQIEKLKNERETLIDISNDLRSQINELKDKFNKNSEQFSNLPDYERLQAQNEIAYERIQELEQELTELRDQIQDFQDVVEDKNKIIQDLRQETYENQVIKGKGVKPLAQISYQNHHQKKKETKSPPQKEMKQRFKIPNYENFLDIDDLENEVVNQFANNEIKGNQIKIQPKERDNSPHYIKNSEKQTESQQKQFQKIQKSKKPSATNFNNIQQE